jgi:hypothetical protein
MPCPRQGSFLIYLMISKLFHGSSVPLLTIAVSIITSKAPTRALYDGYFRQLFRINTKSIPVLESFADNLHPVNIFYLFSEGKIFQKEKGEERPSGYC